MTAKSVDSYIKALPADRRAAISAVRDTINANIADGFEEGILYGMPTWFIPLDKHPHTYNGQPLCLAGVASGKSGMSLHMMCIYGDEVLRTWFVDAFAASGKKLDMGKACVRFKRLDALPLDVLGEAIGKMTVASYIAAYEKMIGDKKARGAKRAAKTKTKAKRPAKKR
jgi:uncharacterized protein YdhG (YjbR/CyaY superfamily)